MYTLYYIVYTYLYNNIITAKTNTPNVLQIGVIRQYYWLGTIYWPGDVKIWTSQLKSIIREGSHYLHHQVLGSLLD